MENLAVLILEINSYDDKDEDEKLKEIIELAHEHKKTCTNLLTLLDYVKLDIESGNFDIEQNSVATEFYKKIINNEL